mgnify:CR=1 FL=1
MKKQLFYFTLLLTFSLTGGLYAQDWVEKMKNPDVNFYDVQKAFNKYYVKKDRQIERQKRRTQRAPRSGFTAGFRPEPARWQQTEARPWR